MSEAHRLECMERFKAAVADGKKRKFGKAKALIESIQTRFGDRQAQIAKKELWAAIQSDNRRWN